MFYRGFVYDHHMDWRNPKNDRARAAYDNFQPLDGQFDDNVIIQIKHGPIDFQVREPASPLFGALEKTNQAIELQITQEYFGQQRHTVFLVPMWKEALDFDLQVRGAGTPVKALVGGTHVQAPRGRIRRRLERRARRQLARQSPVAGESVWLRPAGVEPRPERGRPSPTSGRVPPSATIRAWSTSSANMQLDSWRTLRELHRATGPADTHRHRRGITTAWPSRRPSGTAGASGTAPTTRASAWTGRWRPAPDTSASTRPPVRRRVRITGELSRRTAAVHAPRAVHASSCTAAKTVIQSIYDSHYDGAARVAAYVTRVAFARRPRRRRNVLALFCDSSNTRRATRSCGVMRCTRWFLRASGIADAKGRVGTYPGRVEAESMTLTGYAAVDVTPWETASGDRAAACAAGPCTAAFTYTGSPGTRDIVVQVLRREHGSVPFSPARRRQSGGGVDRWRSLSDEEGGWQFLDAVCGHRRAACLGRPHRD